MWRPTGYVTWAEIVREIKMFSRTALLRACALELNRVTELKARTYIEEARLLVDFGQAESVEEAELAFAIFEVHFLSNFCNCFPPEIASLDRATISLDEIFFQHIDQIECSMFDLPINRCSEFSEFFKLHKIGKFSARDIYARFPLIDYESGQIRPRNGAFDYLINGRSFEDDDANNTIELAKTLKGSIICWNDYPKYEDFKEVVQCLLISSRIKVGFEDLFKDHSAKPTTEKNRRPVGRPSKISAILKAYDEIFPDGHEAEGISRKILAWKISQHCRFSVSESAIGRALAQKKYGQPE